MPMTGYLGTRDPKAADHESWFRVAVTVCALIGVLLLAAATFVLSYAGIRGIAISAGVSTVHAGLFPLILDASLAIAFLAALGLRGAGWRMQAFAWLVIMIVLAAPAMVQVLHAAGTSLPHRPVAATVAAIPWILLLLGFGLALSMLNHLRTVRAVSLPTDRNNRSRTIRRPDPQETGVNYRSDLGKPAAHYRSAGWRTAVDAGRDPDTPDVRLIPPPSRPADTDPDTPDVRLIPPPSRPAETGSGSDPGSSVSS